MAEGEAPQEGRRPGQANGGEGEGGPLDGVEEGRGRGYRWAVVRRFIGCGRRGGGGGGGGGRSGGGGGGGSPNVASQMPRTMMTAVVSSSFGPRQNTRKRRSAAES